MPEEDKEAAMFPYPDTNSLAAGRKFRELKKADKKGTEEKE